MDEKEIFEKFKNILIDKFGIDKDKITPAADLVNDLGIDSFAAIELAYMLEDEFKIKISDEEMPKLKTVGDVIKGIGRKTIRLNSVKLYK